MNKGTELEDIINRELPPDSAAVDAIEKCVDRGPYGTPGIPGPAHYVKTSPRPQSVKITITTNPFETYNKTEQPKLAVVDLNTAAIRHLIEFSIYSLDKIRAINTEDLVWKGPKGKDKRKRAAKTRGRLRLMLNRVVNESKTQETPDSSNLNELSGLPCNAITIGLPEL